MEDKEKRASICIKKFEDSEISKLGGGVRGGRGV